MNIKRALTEIRDYLDATSRRTDHLEPVGTALQAHPNTIVLCDTKELHGNQCLNLRSSVGLRGKAKPLLLTPQALRQLCDSALKRIEKLEKKSASPSKPKGSGNSNRQAYANKIREAGRTALHNFPARS